jgi:hypothetical protein
LEQVSGLRAYPVLTSTLPIRHLWGLHPDNELVINGSALGQRRATRMRSTFATLPKAAEAASLHDAAAID